MPDNSSTEKSLSTTQNDRIQRQQPQLVPNDHIQRQQAQSVLNDHNQRQQPQSVPNDHIQRQQPQSVSINPDCHNCLNQPNSTNQL